jgi:hypothetical protein
MSGLMFSEMFRVLEHLAASNTAVLVSRHGIPHTNSERARQIRFHPHHPAL